MTILRLMPSERLFSLTFITRHFRSLPLRLLRRMGDWPEWRLGLLHDSQVKEKQLYSDDLIVIMADHQPKARFHYLVLPKAPIDTVEQLQPKHIPLLRHMMAMSQEFIDREITPKTANTVRMGFHIIPTFIRLHLHLISEDFDSRYMRSTYAWGSFTTDFLLHPEKAIEMLEKDGKIEIDPIEAADIRDGHSSLLQCHCCSFQSASLKSLKQHIVIHDKDKKEEMKK